MWRRKHTATDGKKQITPFRNFKARLLLLLSIFGSFLGAAKTAPQRQGTFLSRGLPDCHEQASSVPGRRSRKPDLLIIRAARVGLTGLFIDSFSHGDKTLKGFMYDPFLQRFLTNKRVHTASIKGFTGVPQNIYRTLFRPKGGIIMFSCKRSHAVVVPSVGGFAHVL